MNCHNGEKYLKKSVSSIINQSYRNWELIFGTTNPQIIRQNFENFKDKRIKYFYSKKKLFSILLEIWQFKKLKVNS